MSEMLQAEGVLRHRIVHRSVNNAVQNNPTAIVEENTRNDSNEQESKNTTAIVEEKNQNASNEQESTSKNINNISTHMPDTVGECSPETLSTSVCAVDAAQVVKACSKGNAPETSQSFLGQLGVLLAMFVVGFGLHWCGLPMDLSNALGCEAALLVLRSTYQFRDGEPGTSEHAAMICLSCAFSCSCWMTVIANRGSSFLAFNFAATVFLPAISALMKTGFTWFFGGRTLRDDEKNAVLMFFNHHLLPMIVALISLNYSADVDKAKEINNQITNLDTKVSNVSFDLHEVKNNMQDMKKDMQEMKNEFKILSAAIFQVLVNSSAAPISAARPGKIFVGFDCFQLLDRLNYAIIANVEDKEDEGTSSRDKDEGTSSRDKNEGTSSRDKSEDTSTCARDNDGGN
eukprot:CAMPEP_0172205012 /NCGR_PEP_ID=MMETSP1050-20130122/32335_1 /TAXON_ID=233186 /ORGANISM="Cryptomonas curvata, Strain CCAP979/52" /LENGTH=400 /DNA_ID=CAMNT_0012883755 /DNA_START=48 /DNA_END=1252 /DNA_ORIENTATION=+